MEFSDLGKSCAKCNYQDYLPFCCPGCKQWYCSDHRSYDAHTCKNRPTDEHKSSPETTTAVMHKCSFKNCREKSIFEFVCSDCQKNHCINHRLHVVHASEPPVNPTVTPRSVPPKQSSVTTVKVDLQPKPTKRNKKCMVQ